LADLLHVMHLYLRRNGAHVGWAIGLVALLLAGGCQSGTAVVNSTDRFPDGTGFVPGQVTVDGEQRPVWVFVPRNYHPGTKYPAILFLHGLWEKGNGGTNVLSAGLGPVIASDPEHWPFITIFPQSPGDWKGPEREKLAMAALDHAQKRWSIDPDRVILAGLSYGGLGVWEIGARNSHRFAALVPMSGHSAPELVGHLLMLPVWAFVSRGDPWVKAENSLVMCQAIDARGGRARLTEFDAADHDCWGLAVTESDLVTWMLRQRRQPAQIARGPQAMQGTPMASTTGRNPHAAAGVHPRATAAPGIQPAHNTPTAAPRPAGARRSVANPAPGTARALALPPVTAQLD
jgi:dienelactone hydrolase